MGYEGEPQISRQGVEALIDSHLTGIPFENLDIFDGGQVPSIEPEDIYRKIVENRRGGYCFELNRMFYELLKGIGFDVVSVAVRILWRRTGIPPALHRGTIVTLENERYFCDVGFGGPGPQGLLKLEESEQELKGRRFRVTLPEKERWFIECLQGDAFIPVMLVEDRRAEESDFLLMNFYSSRAENVLFTQKRIVNLTTERGSLALNDYTLTIREDGRVSTRELHTKKELEDCLRDTFGICYSLGTDAV